MSFEDDYFSKADRYSIGTETYSSRRYISIPVSNGFVDYEEYYAISDDQYQLFLHDGSAAMPFVEACRRHEHDDLLLQKPGNNRGTPI